MTEHSSDTDSTTTLQIPEGLPAEDGEWLAEVRAALSSATASEKLGFPRGFVPTPQEQKAALETLQEGLTLTLDGKSQLAEWLTAAQNAAAEIAVQSSKLESLTRSPFPKATAKRRKADLVEEPSKGKAQPSVWLSFLVLASTTLVSCAASGYFDVVLPWARVLFGDSSVVGQICCAGFVAIFASVPTWFVNEAVRRSRLLGGIASPWTVALHYLCAYSIAIVAFGFTAHFFVPMMGPHRSWVNLLATFAPLLVFWWSAGLLEGFAGSILSRRIENEHLSSLAGTPKKLLDRTPSYLTHPIHRKILRVLVECNVGSLLFFALLMLRHGKEIDQLPQGSGLVTFAVIAIFLTAYAGFILWRKRGQGVVPLSSFVAATTSLLIWLCVQWVLVKAAVDNINRETQPVAPARERGGFIPGTNRARG